jgi:phosphoribosylamine--glycine ligase
LFAAAAGQLDDAPPARFSEDFALTVVMAANGYPGGPIMGGVIGGLDAAQADGAVVFHAGTAMTEGRLVASGGRVLNITARGISVTQAQQRAYTAVDRIDFPGGFCRRDIGWREVARESGGAR